ncbi:exopolysaccharide biosynthesis polyprenyl glycosylphosphotransferase [Arenicellales bacterium IMCC56312]
MASWLNKNSKAGAAFGLADMALLLVFIVFGHRLRLDYDLRIEFSSEVLLISVFNIFLLYLMGGYNFDKIEARGLLLLKSVAAVCSAGALISTATFFLRADATVVVLWRGNLATAMFLFVAWIGLSRTVYFILTRNTNTIKSWLFIGSNYWSDRLDLLRSQSKLSVNIQAVILDLPDNLRMIMSVNDEIHVDADSGIQIWEKPDGIIVEHLEEMHPSVRQNLLLLKNQGFAICYLSEFCENQFGRFPEIKGMHERLLGPDFESNYLLEISWKIKRLVDIFAASLLLLLALPILALLVIVIKIDSRGGALFSQSRTGKAGVEFTVYKLRTMYQSSSSDVASWTQENDPRVTRVGRFLRKARLDELPQLWNVIVGDMSLVGPRPEQPDLVQKLETVLPSYDIRHLIRPGLTGWAQIKYPYGSSIEDARSKLEFDLYYLKHFSLLLDAYIMLKTVRVVLSSDGR